MHANYDEIEWDYILSEKKKKKLGLILLAVDLIAMICNGIYIMIHFPKIIPLVSIGPLTVPIHGNWEGNH